MTRRDAFTADLFAVPQPAALVPASMDYRVQVSQLVARMLAEAASAGIDRYEVSSRASRLAGYDITKNMLDGYTSEAREAFNMPLWVAPVVEAVCSSTLLTEWHAQVRGGRVSFGAATIDAEIGRIEHEREQATARLKQLKEMRRRAR